MPQDTSALLRQLLTSPDPFSRLISMLTGSGGLAVALLGLLGLLSVEAPQIGEAAVLMIDRRYGKSVKPMPPPVIVKGWRWEKPQNGRGGIGDVSASGATSEPRPLTDWASELTNKPVTVWLRSGRKVTGDAKGLQNAAVVQGTDPVLTVLRLATAMVSSKDDDDAPQNAGSVFIPVAAIDVIGFAEPSNP